MEVMIHGFLNSPGSERLLAVCRGRTSAACGWSLQPIYANENISRKPLDNKLDVRKVPSITMTRNKPATTMQEIEFR